MKRSAHQNFFPWNPVKFCEHAEEYNLKFEKSVIWTRNNRLTSPWVSSENPFSFFKQMWMLNLQFIELICIFKREIFIVERTPNVMYRIFARPLYILEINFIFCIRNMCIIYMHFDFYDYGIYIRETYYLFMYII